MYTDTVITVYVHTLIIEYTAKPTVHYRYFLQTNTSVGTAVTETQI